ncbi:hypothetical protein C9J21_18250 [Photobacterium phosphoreum]|uniref:hypothetical protein n=1 Tax=Photobacterium phosphoreum TaxID=659 RepID=UPI000D168698|nr:hypothetical protein [Photobacterium phosphoreum]PSW30829.1 hypothetical protein C9J21_18250 [Photobacterium phosphoreum]
MSEITINIPPRIDWCGNKEIPPTLRYAATYNQSSREKRLECYAEYEPCEANSTTSLAKELFTEDGDYAECWAGNHLIGLCNFSLNYNESDNSLVMWINAECMINRYTLPFENTDAWAMDWLSAKNNHEYWFTMAVAGIVNEFLDQFKGKNIPKVTLDADIDSYRENFWLGMVFAHLQSHYEFMGGKLSNCTFECDW